MNKKVPRPSLSSCLSFRPGCQLFFLPHSHIWHPIGSSQIVDLISFIETSAKKQARAARERIPLRSSFSLAHLFQSELIKRPRSSRTWPYTRPSVKELASMSYWLIHGTGPPRVDRSIARASKSFAFEIRVYVYVLLLC